MLSRVAYAFRETWASFRRNLTLTAAAVLTSAVSLLLVGTTFLVQRGFDNLLVRWKGDVQLIVFMAPDAAPENVAYVESVIKSQPNVVDIEKLAYLDKPASFEEAQKLFAGDPTMLSLLTPETIPTQFKIVSLTDDSALLRSLADQYRILPKVQGVSLAEDEFEVISTLSGFVRTVTIVMSLVLLAVAVTLIWNTIRTAMFARRREIEVMKLVGATNWFIRIPFMLEGLLARPHWRCAVVWRPVGPQQGLGKRCCRIQARHRGQFARRAVGLRVGDHASAACHRCACRCHRLGHCGQPLPRRVTVGVENPMAFSDILFDVTDGIATITLNRPDAMNSFTNQMARDLRAAFDEVDANDDIRVVIVTGAGSGMGAAFARRLAADGAHVVVNDIDEAGAGRVGRGSGWRSRGVRRC